MDKNVVISGLRSIRDADKKWREAKHEYTAERYRLLSRLIPEALINFMSVEEIAKESGLTVKGVRLRMRLLGLDPKKGKRALSQTAAKALSENAALLGVSPDEMDLTSPLAYLPMGKQMREQLANDAVSRVTEIEGDPDGFPDGLSYEERSFNELADTIYDEMPWEGETYQAVAEQIAHALIKRGVA